MRRREDHEGGVVRLWVEFAAIFGLLPLRRLASYRLAAPLTA